MRWRVRLGELRVGLKLNRPQAERRQDPRERPLSHDIGAVCAGMAAAEGPLGFAQVRTQDELEELKAAFPAADGQYPVFYQPTW